MATNGITDVFTTVSVQKPEYEELIRESEQLNVIKLLLKKNDFVSTGDLRTIVNISKEKEEGEE